MSEATATVKPARNKFAASEKATLDAPSAKPAQKLREAMPKKFAPSSLWVLGQEYEILAVSVPADWTFEDVLRPLSWSATARVVAKDANSAGRDKIGSLVYASGPNFSAWLRINAVQRDHFGSPNGLDVICVGPSVNPDDGFRACPVDVKTGLPWVDPSPAKED